MLGLGAGLRAAGVEAGWIHAGLTAAGFLACLFFLLRSQADELGLNRREPVV